MPTPPKVQKVDDSAFFVLGDYTLNISQYETDWARTSPVINEPFEKVEIEEEPAEDSGEEAPIIQAPQEEPLSSS